MDWCAVTMKILVIVGSDQVAKLGVSHYYWGLINLQEHPVLALVESKTLDCLVCRLRLASIIYTRLSKVPSYCQKSTFTLRFWTANLLSNLPDC